MSRKICVVTGTRAEYGIFYPVLEAIKTSSDLELYLIVTGMHLMKEFGYTVKEIEEDGVSIYQRIEIAQIEDTGKAMANSVGKAVTELANCFDRLQPDIVVILGDRGEMLAAAVAANYLNIPIAHIHGGEISGHVDGLMRHAITKMAHIHFPATPESKSRIIKMGEEPWRIFQVGAPALDRILNQSLPAEAELRKKYLLSKDKPFLLVVQHPVSIESNEAGGQMEITLEAVIEVGLPAIAIYPNADAGGREMISVIKKYALNCDLIKLIANASHEDYLGLMKISAVLVGNTSSGIIEAPSFRLAVVNIGIRQEGRERSTNIIDVPHNKKAIVQAIKKALYDQKFREKVKSCKNPYGDGHASERITKVLEIIKLDKKLFQKKMTY